MPDETREKEPNKMKKRFLPNLTYANVVASLALFLALGGAAVAATALPRKSVGPKQLRPGAVRSIAIARGAVTSRKLAPRSVVVGKLGPGAVTPGNLGNGAVTSDKIAAGAVIAASIKNGAITNNKLGNEVVTANKLGKGSVTLAKLGSDVAPLLGTLKAGQTLRGTFDLGGKTEVAREGIGFQFPLVNPPAAPEANILDENGKTTACPGLAGANKQTPEAAAGQLCVYVKTKSAEFQALSFDANGLNRLGFGLVGEFKAATGANQIQGFWAVTAP
jgi:hypothetical protein